MLFIKSVIVIFDTPSSSPILHDIRTLVGR